MRRILVAVTLLLVVVPQAAARYDAKTPPPQSRVLAQSSSGELKVLSLKRITVDRLSCGLDAHVPKALARFVVGDPVAITCKSGALRTIRYAPLPPSKSVATGVNFKTTPAVVSAGSMSLPSSSSTVSTGSIVLLEFVGPGSAPSRSSHGPVTVLDENGVTVGELTCPLIPALLPFVTSHIHVGDVITLSCK